MNREIGISRICGGNRLPINISNRIVRRNGIEYRASPYAASDASPRLRITAGIVTSRLLTSARNSSAFFHADWYVENVNECGSEPSPFAATSSKLRNEITTTHRIGAIQSSETRPITTW